MEEKVVGLEGKDNTGDKGTTDKRYFIRLTRSERIQHMIFLSFLQEEHVYSYMRKFCNDLIVIKFCLKNREIPRGFFLV